MEKLRHFDTFSGYGGFTISAQKLGWETVGFSEVDKYANAVLEYNFNIKNYGDITKIKGEDLPDVDIITGGSPCQDLSVAGKGAGLDGGRSGLFFCFINLIKEKQPMYFVWENVKGALSSSRGWDFARVQIEMEQAGYDVWWQLINAKDFGVPQNRERIFAIGIRKGSGREVLFEQRNTEQNIKKLIDGAKAGSRQAMSVYSVEGQSTTLASNGGGLGAKTGLYAVKASYRNGLRETDISPTIDTMYKKGFPGLGQDRAGVIVHNLQPRSPNRPSLLKNKNAGGSGHLQREDGITYTVDTGGTQGVQVIGNLYNSGGENGDVLDPRGISKTIKSGETSTKGNGGIGSSNSPKILSDMRIRRLTPTECERLMGLKDGWTAKGIIDGKEVDISDTQRYKMCGNGVVVNCVDYIYKLLRQ